MITENLAWQWFGHLMFVLLAAACIIPFVLLISSSFTDEKEILQNGYSFLPKVFSTEAYSYLFSGGSSIGRAYGVTVFVTVVGTTISLLITSLLAYPISRADFPARNAIALCIFVTLLFHGGLVPTYLVYTQIFDLKNTIWALMIPGILMNGFSVMLMRTFFQTSIPMPVIESANMDGAGEWRIYWSFVLPLSMPIMATTGLLQTLLYWNDWTNGTIYLTDSKLYGIQNLLNRILSDSQFLASNNFGSGPASEAALAPTAAMKMAIAVLGVIPILVAYPFFQKYFVKGIAIGAVKG